MIILLLQLLIVALILGLAVWLVSQIPGAAPFAHIVQVVCIVIFVVYILYLLMSFVSSGHLPALR